MKIVWVMKYIPKHWILCKLWMIKWKVCLVLVVVCRYKFYMVPKYCNIVNIIHCTRRTLNSVYNVYCTLYTLYLDYTERVISCPLQVHPGLAGVYMGLRGVTQFSEQWRRDACLKYSCFAGLDVVQNVRQCRIKLQGAHRSSTYFPRTTRTVDNCKTGFISLDLDLELLI